jgi:hypothetical protein
MSEANVTLGTVRMSSPSLKATNDQPAGITFSPLFTCGLRISDLGFGIFKIYIGLLDLLNLLAQTEKLSQGWDKTGQAA